jgi:hypothetical protein
MVEYKNLATLFKKVETLRWRGATPAFAAWAERMKAPRLLERCEKAAIEKGSTALPNLPESECIQFGSCAGRNRG